MKTIWMGLCGLPIAVASCGERDLDVEQVQAGGATEDGAAPSPPLADAGTPSFCDGSTQLKLALVKTSCCGTVDSFLDTQVGADYLYVTGDCRYWARKYVSNPGWSPARTGTLSQDEVRRLADEVGHGQYATFQPLYDVETGIFGPLYSTLYDGDAAVRCKDVCYEGHPTAPVAVQEMWSAATSWIERLWEMGATPSGGMRVEVVKLVGDVEWQVEACVPLWPFALDPEWVVNQGTPSVLVSDPMLTTELREWWLAYRDDPMGCNGLTSGSSVGFVSNTESNVLYRLALREALPIEDDTGSIVIP